MIELTDFEKQLCLSDTKVTKAVINNYHEGNTIFIKKHIVDINPEGITTKVEDRVYCITKLLPGDYAICFAEVTNIGEHKIGMIGLHEFLNSPVWIYKDKSKKKRDVIEIYMLDKQGDFKMIFKR